MVNVRFRHSADIPNVGGRADTTAIARFNTGARQLHNALHNRECAHEIQSMSQRLSVGTFVSRRPHQHLADNFLFRRDLQKPFGNSLGNKLQNLGLLAY